MKMINQKHGFTLIETLVAISILMIAIAGPLTVANKAYTSALNARNQSVASNLAQEGLEYVNNMKANNTWPDGSHWVHVDGAYPQVPNIFGNCAAGCPDNLVGNTITGTPIYFTRTYYFNYGNSGISDADQVLVTVKVTWLDGPTQSQVQLQEILTDFER
jgi:prepilin-type N-terminal cleavage/methylation domain-containing protein